MSDVRYYMATFTEIHQPKVLEGIYKPIIMAKIGRASDDMLLDSGLKESTDRGVSSFDIFSDLDHLMDHCLSRFDVNNIVVDDNMSASDRSIISKHINAYIADSDDSDMFGSVSQNKLAYIRVMSGVALCEQNKLDVNFRNSNLWAGCCKYAEALDENGLKGRSSVFEHQAALMREHGIQFSGAVLRDLVSVQMSDENFESKSDDLYKNTAELYGHEYVGVDDFYITDSKEIGDHKKNVIVLSGGVTYSVDIDVSLDVSESRQIADNLCRIKIKNKQVEKEIAEMGAVRRAMTVGLEFSDLETGMEDQTQFGE